MSELKSYKLFHRASALTSPEFLSVVEFGNGDEVYLKYEADKVIAEKDKVIDYARRLVREDLKTICHQKFKRCLAMARWCESENYTDCWYHENSERCKWTEKWHNRWLELAEKFKEGE